MICPTSKESLLVILRIMWIRLSVMKELLTVWLCENILPRTILMKFILKPFNYFFIGFSYLASKKIVVIMIFLLFISLLDKTYAYKEEIANFEVENMKNKSMEEIKVYDNDNFIINENSALEEKISCYNQNIKTEELPSNILTKTNELNELYKSNTPYIIMREKNIPNFEELIIDTKKYIEGNCQDNEYINKYKVLGDNTNFFFKKTIYKVKKNG